MQNPEISRSMFKTMNQNKINTYGKVRGGWWDYEGVFLLFVFSKKTIKYFNKHLSWTPANYLFTSKQKKWWSLVKHVRTVLWFGDDIITNGRFSHGSYYTNRDKAEELPGLGTGLLKHLGEAGFAWGFRSGDLGSVYFQFKFLPCHLPAVSFAFCPHL